MTDNREVILARLVQIARDLFGAGQVARNVTEITESPQAFAVILDGDETSDEADLRKGRGSCAPRRVTMTPQVLIAVSAASVSVGTLLNAARARMIEAVLSDATLAALCATGDPIVYAGAMSDLASGRKMSGQIALQFRLTYLLVP